MRSDQPKPAPTKRPPALKAPAPRPQAKPASRQGRRPAAAPAPKSKPIPGIRTLAAILLAALAALALARAVLPLWGAAFYLAASALSFYLYRQDKAAAAAGEWRISEATLHGVDLCGGIIGGLLAQQRFRHKTRKASFVLATAGIALLHLLALAALALGLIAPGGLASLLP